MPHGTSFVVDGVHCRLPYDGGGVTVQPIMKLINLTCLCDLGYVDQCYPADRYEWRPGDPAPRFATAGTP